MDPPGGGHLRRLAFIPAIKELHVRGLIVGLAACVPTRHSLRRRVMPFWAGK